MKIDRILFDGDILCHKAGAVSEVRYYSVVWPDGNSYLAYRRVKLAREYIADKLGHDIRMDQEELPFSVATSVIEGLIKSTCDELGCDDYTIFLSPDDSSSNFRYKIDPEYKANRAKLMKPKHFSKIRQYIKDNHPTHLTKKIEADDGLGIVQTRYSKEGKTSVICSIDKDLLQIPGLHYNPDKKQLIEASDPGKLWLGTRKSGKKDLKGYGFMWFCAQLLLGDPVDNIKGIKGIGDVKAYELLSPFVGDPEATFRDIIGVIKQVYRKNDRLKDLDNNMRLLWILREETDLTGGMPAYLSHIPLPSTRTGDVVSLEPTSQRKDESTDSQ